ncbi:MAG: DUF5906 domain-containing protein [Limisphaerales bacterium]
MEEITKTEAHSEDNELLKRDAIEGEFTNITKSEDPIYQKYGQPIVADDKKLKFNETAIAHKIASKFQMAFEVQTKQFYVYTRGAWIVTQPTAICGMISDFLREVAEEHNHSELSQLTKASTLDSISKMIKCRATVPVVSEEKALFPVSNGVIDLRGDKAKFIDHNPEFGFRWCSPVEFNPNATCVRFETELLQAGMDKDDISLVQRYMGSLLLGTNSAQRMLVMQGIARGGKSTLVSIIEHIIGDHRTAYLRPQHLTGRFEFCGFAEKRLLCGKDVPGESLSEKGAKLIKSLIGGDRLESETKYVAGKRKFEGDLHLVIHCNSNLRLALDGDEEAWRRRLLVVEYARRSEKEIPDFAKILLNEEASGILNWLIAGAESHKLELKKGNFVLTEAQQARVDNVIDESRSPLVFVQTCIRKAHGKNITVADASTNYAKFCSTRRWIPVADKHLQTALREHMAKIHQSYQSHNVFPEKQKTAVRGYRGVDWVK